MSHAEITVTLKPVTFTLKNVYDDETTDNVVKRIMYPDNTLKSITYNMIAGSLKIDNFNIDIINN